MHVIATAGHVDHGKSTLVRALTGTDPDRWDEEKRRGLTIDLGFASTRLPSGQTIAFVDVPGHVRFLKNMLAGVGGVEACLFVVAATEGWKRQSEEHLRILELVGIRHGVVALTKVDLVDDERRADARRELDDHLGGTFLADAGIVEIDGTSDDTAPLAAALDVVVAHTETPADRDRPRLWIDRAFSAPGAGTVVTGTLTHGRVRVGDEMAVLPAGRRVRVRGAQALHQPSDEIGPGSRAALNLAGVHHHEVTRGDVVVEPGRWHQTATVDASLHVLAALDHPVSRKGAYVAYFGSGEYPAQLRVIDTTGIAPGERGTIRLRLGTALPLLPGDRYVLRDSGREETVGGGEVLDVEPLLPASRARPDRSTDRVIAERGWVDVDELERLTGERRPPDAGRWVVDPVAFEETRRELSDAIDAAGTAGLDVAVLDERERAALTRVADVTVVSGRVRRGSAPSAFDDHAFLAELAAQPFQPPPPVDVSREDLRELVQRGLVIEADGTYFAADAARRAAAVVAGLLAERPEGVTVSDVRRALGTTRKYVLPLLAHLGATRRTRRHGDRRVAGPPLARGAEA
jgi:selenocysteine-specific elongation factor